MKYFFVILLVVLSAGAYIVMRPSFDDAHEGEVHTKPSHEALEQSADPKNMSYRLDWKTIQLHDGVYEEAVSEDSASKRVVKYFGNEVQSDLNGDGMEDIAFIATEEGGGSGVFYYAFAMVSTPTGYVGSDGYLLGDRIAPQSTEISTEGKHSQVVVFNFADRKEGEQFSTPPSVSKSVYLKIDPETRSWGVVLPSFEGESAK